MWGLNKRLRFGVGLDALPENKFAWAEGMWSIQGGKLMTCVILHTFYFRKMD